MATVTTAWPPDDDDDGEEGGNRADLERALERLRRHVEDVARRFESVARSERSAQAEKVLKAFLADEPLPTSPSSASSSGVIQALHQISARLDRQIELLEKLVAQDREARLRGIEARLTALEDRESPGDQVLRGVPNGSEAAVWLRGS